MNSASERYIEAQERGASDEELEVLLYERAIELGVIPANGIGQKRTEPKKETPESTSALEEIKAEQKRVNAEAIERGARENPTRLQPQPIEVYDPEPPKPGPRKQAEWLKPLNILQEFVARPFTPDLLPAPLAEFPAAYSESTGIDPSITLTAAISTAAAALSDGFQIVADAKTCWYQSARLWVLVVGPPGAGKSPAQREMLKPLWAIQRELLSEHAQQCRDLEKDDPKPPMPKVVIVDATIEALSGILEHTTRGLLISNDEFEGFMGSLDAYRGKGPSRDRAEYLRLFDGGPHSVERVQRGSIFVENWGVSILSATTPSAMAKLSRYLPEDGLLARFFPVCAQRQGTSEDRPDIEGARERYEQTIRRLYYASPKAHGGRVSMSLEASKLFSAFRLQNQKLQEAMSSSSPPFEAHLAKHPTMVLRVALAFHAAEIVNLQEERARDIAAWPVTAQTMELAIKFMHRVSQHAMPIYMGMKGGSDAFELARDIGRSILAQGCEHFARRDLLRRVRAFRAAQEFHQTAALNVLIDAAWIREGEGGYAKAQPTKFAVNPRLAGTMAHQAEIERERRAAVREMIRDAVEDSRANR